MPQMTYTETLIVTSCYCGIPFAIPDNLHGWMNKSSKNSCHCPNGHVMHFTNSLEDKLAESERRRLATQQLLAAEERSHSATKGHLTKAKKQIHRVEHGVCPHCNRSFQNLARHMKSKHEAS